MKLSILDQAPISDGQTEKEALEASIALAKMGDMLGYTRFWVAEHHDLFGLACPNPAVMLSAMGAQTTRIKLGAGAVLLPYYKPFHVAETYNFLETLYPNRIDIGLGRAPGGPAEVSLALSDNYLEAVRNFGQDIDELHHFLNGDFPKGHTYEAVRPTPVPKQAPRTWMLGTSGKSSQLAIEKNMPYVFGHFMSDENGVDIVRQYKNACKNPYVIIAVHVICADTNEEAEQLAKSVLLWQKRQQDIQAKQTIPTVEEAMKYELTEKDRLKMKEKMIVGNQEEVTKQLYSIYQTYDADELMIVTITHDVQAKQHSYQLIMDGIRSFKFDE